MICKKTMDTCRTPGMCSPHGGCPDQTQTDLAALRNDFDAERLRADTAEAELVEIKESLAYRASLLVRTEKRAIAAEQSATVVVDGLRNFANDIIDITLDGGDAYGSQIQELAVKHGLLKPEQRAERCSDVCSCAEYGDFPVECFRKVKELNP